MDAKTKQEIEEKAGQYETAKKKIKERIEENVRIAIQKLMDLERELLVEMEAELGENPFVEFLGGEDHIEDDAKEIQRREIPRDFGPDDDSFKSLSKEIESLRAWRKKPKPEQLIPKNITVKDTSLDSISISWDAVEGAKNYLVEVDDGDEVFWRSGISNTFTKAGLIPDTEHTFRVRTIHEKMISEWSNVVRGRTKKLPAPTNVKTRITEQDSITLTWDDGMMGSFYQIEVDGGRSLERVTNSFTKRELLPETEHAFRIRAVRGNSVGEWSDVVKGKTLKASPYGGSVWKECSGYVGDKRKYSVDERNPRIATNINGGGNRCTIIGNTPLPLNKVTSWNIKILKSEGNNGDGISIGVAPSDINQNEDYNCDKCGWYFGCYHSWLYSGPPHNYRDKVYGPRKGSGEYVHTGDIVGVVIDTTRGDLSFILNGVKRDIAYEEIPLDKPLVPCVILWYNGDSVEFVI